MTPFRSLRKIPHAAGKEKVVVCDEQYLIRDGRKKVVDEKSFFARHTPNPSQEGKLYGFSFLITAIVKRFVLFF